jgi:thiamine pyrophosphate-dependent acetolactate synthase large subunit-like protein
VDSHHFLLVLLDAAGKWKREEEEDGAAKEESLTLAVRSVHLLLQQESPPMLVYGTGSVPYPLQEFVPTIGDLCAVPFLYRTKHRQIYPSVAPQAVLLLPLSGCKRASTVTTTTTMMHDHCHGFRAREGIQPLRSV